MKVQSICRSCSAGCGIVAEVVDGRLIGVQGDVGHPLSHGYLCPKGHSLPWSHDRDDRLDYPTIRGQRATWPQFINDIVGRLIPLVHRYGPDCVGWYEGNGTASDTLGRRAMAQLFRGLGSTQQYSAVSIDIAPAWRVAQLVTGSPLLLPQWKPEDVESKLVVCIGVNPSVSHGYVTNFPDPVRRINRFRRRGGRMWVVDPRTTRTASIADHHLSIRPGTDHLLLGWLVRELLISSSVSPEFRDATTSAERARLAAALARCTLAETVTATGLASPDLHQLADDVARAGRVAIVTGTGVTFQRHALLIEWLRWVLLLATDSLDRPGGMWFHPGYFAPWDLRVDRLPSTAETLPPPRSRPALQRMLGEIPVVAMGDEIRSGRLRALFVDGGNPMSAFPDPETTAEFLGRLDLLAVADVIPSATTEVATHVAAVTGQMERTDLVVRAHAMVAPAVVAPGIDRRPMWWIAAHLGKHLGVDVLGGADPDQVTEADLLRTLLSTGRTDLGDPFEFGSYGVELPNAWGFVKRLTPHDRWNIVPEELIERLEMLQHHSSTAAPFTFINGRQVTRNCSMQFVPGGKSRDRGTVAVNPQDAASLELATDDLVRIVGEDGAVVVAVDVNPNVPAGVVWVAQGWVAHNVSRLTSTSRYVDPLSGQPAMTALPVRLERL